MNEYNQSPGDDARKEVEQPPPAPAQADSPPPAASEVPTQVAPPVPPQPTNILSPSEIQSKKLASGLLGILLGGLGIHKFYLGYQTEGIIMILITLVGGGTLTAISCGLLSPSLMVMPIIGMVEGIIYLTKTDEDFAETYLRNKRPWF